MPDAPQLEDQVLAALERALRERREDVAEHLLRALEALCEDASPGSPLADAYLAVVAPRGSCRRRHPGRACPSYMKVSGFGPGR
jgi:hypothetical protein